MIRYPITIKQWKGLKDWSVDIAGQVFTFQYGFRKPWTTKAEAELRARKFAESLKVLQNKITETEDD